MKYWNKGDPKPTMIPYACEVYRIHSQVWAPELSRPGRWNRFQRRWPIAGNEGLKMRKSRVGSRASKMNLLKAYVEQTILAEGVVAMPKNFKFTPGQLAAIRKMKEVTP